MQKRMTKKKEIEDRYLSLLTMGNETEQPYQGNLGFI